MEHFNAVSFRDVDIMGGFWASRQLQNYEVTTRAVYERFKEFGRFEAFKFGWKPGDDEKMKPHIFWDSDVAKWIEAVAYILEKRKDDELEAIADEIVDLIEEHQDANGYFNIHFTVVRPNERFTHRTDHELYCAGHLIEAAVAYYLATGKRKFMDLMCKYADHIEKVFKIEGSAAFVTPGHQEIEQALVKLYRVTEEKRYLDLASFFIDERGKHEKDNIRNPIFTPDYYQSHLPVREQPTVEGHSVRVMYMLMAMADLAYETNDKTLFEACDRLFENTVNKRMYITGGIGSSTQGEAFTIDYDLPNLTAYTESCASIGLMMFAQRMLKLKPDSKYAEIIERELYNGFLSNIGLDGKSFFYENPMEIDPPMNTREISIFKKTTLPATQRAEMFTCACCPPNIMRLMATIGDYLYTHDENTLYVHQFIESRASVDMTGGVTITQTTGYPASGRVTFHVKGMLGKKLAVRQPQWAKAVEGNRITDMGYAIYDVNSDDYTLELDFGLSTVWYEANPEVHEDAGKVALMYGPYVMCLEGVDNGENVADIYVKPCKDAVFTPVFDEKLKATVLKTKGYRRKPFAELYRPLGDDFEETALTFIPYFAIANRGETSMRVWINRK